MMSAEEPEEIVDATVVEDGAPAEKHAPPAAQSSALVRRERRSEVLRPLDSASVLESFAEYQDLLQRLLTPDDWQGTPGRTGSFVKKKGWRKIATAFDLDVQIVRSEVERDEQGNPLRAEVWARAVAPSGRSMDGDGYCAADEQRFKSAGGRQKIENDLRATATTRAMNRAISGLVGMGAVSAEEAGPPAPAADTKHPFGRPVPAKQLEQTQAAIGYVLELVVPGVDYQEVTGLIDRIAASTSTKAEEHYTPYIACRAVALFATLIKQLLETAETPGEGDPAGESPEEKADRERAEGLAAKHGA